MQKIVINGCFGGFSLSPEALLWLHRKGCTRIATPVGEWFHEYPNEKVPSYMRLNESLAMWRAHKASGKSDSLFLTAFSDDEQFVLYEREIARDDPLLVQCVEELGERANGSCASLRIVEVPTDVEWVIEEYDGSEHIAEAHRTWS